MYHNKQFTLFTLLYSLVMSYLLSHYESIGTYWRIPYGQVGGWGQSSQNQIPE